MLKKTRILSLLPVGIRRVVVSGLVAVSLAATASPAGADERGAAQALSRIRTQPALLNQFLWDLPKGGDIHMHLSGAVYAEDMVRY